MVKGDRDTEITNMQGSRGVVKGTGTEITNIQGSRDVVKGDRDTEITNMQGSRDVVKGDTDTEITNIQGSRGVVKGTGTETQTTGVVKGTVGWLLKVPATC